VGPRTALDAVEKSLFSLPGIPQLLGPPARSLVSTDSAVHFCSISTIVYNLLRPMIQVRLATSQITSSDVLSSYPQASY
jgi:hypothetical protein